jgi:Flp pilus assembly protein TadG
MSRRSGVRQLGRALHEDERGQNIIEFVLTFLIVLLVTFGMVEFFSIVYTKTVLSDAVNEGLRYAIVNSTNVNNATIGPIVQQYASTSLHDTSSMTVNVNCFSTCAPPDTVRVTATYVYLPYFASFTSSPPTLTAYAEGVTVH